MRMGEGPRQGDVFDAATVVDVPRSLLGQAASGFIQLREGTGPVQLKAIQHAASLRLANQKLSECLPPIALFPRNFRGKSDRAQLIKRQNHSSGPQ
jgi:acyl-CoA synthetase (AMP-forming)/AMP-acid ligase II